MSALKQLPQETCERLEKSEAQEARLLEEAVVKLVLYGRKVGVLPEQMIDLLDSGMSMSDLLAFLASKNSGAA
jgi:hypothetical protein